MSKHIEYKGYTITPEDDGAWIFDPDNVDFRDWNQSVEAAKTQIDAWIAKREEWNAMPAEIERLKAENHDLHKIVNGLNANGLGYQRKINQLLRLIGELTERLETRIAWTPEQNAFTIREIDRPLIERAKKEASE